MAGAQLPSVGAPPRQLLTEPSVASRYLAEGRLAMAERELFAAVEAAPRGSAPRGELARYLASRGRFRVAQVLFDEARRFGADPGIVARAIAEMAPYLPPAESERAARVSGIAATARLVMVEDGTVLARVEAQTAAGGVTLLLDPTVEGVTISSETDPAVPVRAAGGRGAARTLTIVGLTLGGRTLDGLVAVVDPVLRPGEVRLGVDVLWQLDAVVDERAGLLVLPAPGAARPIPPRAHRIPFVLGFPGLLLVEAPGVAPFGIESPPARRLLRGAVWWIDREGSTVVVTR